MPKRKDQFILVLVTAKDRQQARQIGEGLLRQKLIACANLVGPVHSLFWWKKKIDESEEILLLAKTTRKLFGQAARAVKKMHSYETPEIIAVPIIEGSADYLKWVGESVV